MKNLYFDFKDQLKKDARGVLSSLLIQSPPNQLQIAKVF